MSVCFLLSLTNPGTLGSISICHVWLVRQVSSYMERTSSGNWFWPELPCLWIRNTQFSSSGRSKRGNLESCGGKNVSVSLGPFRLIWPEPVLFGRPDRTNGKPPKFRDDTRMSPVVTYCLSLFRPTVNGHAQETRGVITGAYASAFYDTDFKILCLKLTLNRFGKILADSG